MAIILGSHGFSWDLMGFQDFNDTGAAASLQQMALEKWAPEAMTTDGLMFVKNLGNAMVSKIN